MGFSAFSPSPFPHPPSRLLLIIFPPQDGVHKAQSDRQRLTGDMLKLLKTQDRTYIQTLQNHEARAIEKLRAELVHASSSSAAAAAGGGSSRHMVFDEDGKDGAEVDAGDEWDDADGDDDEEEEEEEAPRPTAGRKRGRAGDDDDEEDDDGGDGGAGAGAVKKPKKTAAETEASRKAAKAATKARAQLEKATARRYRELSEREARAKKLETLGAHMDLGRALLKKGRRTKVADGEGDAPAVYKWRDERKR